MPDAAAFSRNEGFIIDCQKSVTLKITDASLKAVLSDSGLSKSPAITSTPCEASATALGEDGSRVTARSVYGDGNRERKWAIMEPP